MKKLNILFSLVLMSVAAMAQYTIYPVPQKMTAKEGTAQFSEEVCLVCDKAVDQATINRAKQVLEAHGLKGNVTEGQQQCTSVIYLKVDPSVAVDKKFDAHTISLKAQGDGMAQLTITGQHTDATFYGLATLDQMLEQAGRSSLPCVEISDYADQQQRGIVEGYYGYPYSVAVKKDLMDFMMRMKMNTYLYGAKSDPYHSTNWKDAYPTTITAEQEKGGWLTQDMVRELSEKSAQTKVNFIWAIHPGNSFVGSSTVVSDIMTKFKLMHKLGVRQFGVFVDDVGIPSSDEDMKINADRLTELQHTIENTFNKPGAEATDTVRPLHFVPQIYCRSFASSQDQFERFFRALANTPSYVVVYTTGWGVWSVPNVSDYNNTAQYLGREVAWWWNYPCNDNADSQIYPMDMYQNFVDMPAVGNSSTLPASMQNRGMGIVSNPMQQGEVAKTPLFSVADYAWHCGGFKNKTSWEASFNFVLKDKDMAEAYKAVAPYLTYNDPSTGWITPSTAAATALKKVNPLLESVEQLCTLKESTVESDRLLYADLEPWLLKLRQMLLTAQQLYTTQPMSNTDENGNLNTEKWMSYMKGVEGMESLENSDDFIVKTIEGKNYTAVADHRVKPSQKVLAAVLENLKSAAIKGFIPARSSRATVLTNAAVTASASLSSGVASLSVAAANYKPGEYMGFSLPEARFATVAVQDTLLQGRELWYSANGREWHTLQIGEQPESPVRHVIVVNTSSTVQSTKFTKSVLSVTPMPDPTITKLTLPEGNEYGGHESKYLTDGDYSTWFTMNANQKNGDTYMLTLSAEVPLRTVRVAIGTTNGDYMNTGRIEISTDGKTWTKLSPVGKTKTTFTISDMTEYSAEAKVLDFDAKGKPARYVRLYNATANTNKWLRIYELEPIYALVETEAVSAKGADLALLTDGQAYTSEVVDGSFIFRLQQVNDAESVTVLDEAGIHTYPVDDARATEQSIVWTGGKRRVYEAFATFSKEAENITGIEVPTVGSGITSTHSTMTFDLQGRAIPALQGGREAASPVLPSGIYIQGGRKIINK